MGSKFNFEGYPNYQFFKNNIHENYKSTADNSHLPEKNMYQVQQIISQNSISPVIEFTLQFPKRYPSIEIIDSVAHIKDISTHILKDTVLINGNIHKRISYICFEGSCDGQEPYFYQGSTVGNLKVLSSDIPFSCSEKVLNIQPSDRIDMEYAGTDPSCMFDILENPIALTGNKITLYKSLKEKLIINIRFNVLRLIQTNL